MKHFLLIKAQILILFPLLLCSCGIRSSQEEISGHVYDYDTAFSAEQDSIHIFYEMLPEKDKMVYSLFDDLISNKDSSDYSNILLVNKAEYEELTLKHFWNIYYAMCYDHPEYFFLLTENSPRIRAYTSESDGHMKIEFKLNAAPENENKRIDEFKSSCDAFLSDIDLTLEDSEVALQIHDKLMDLVSFDYELYESPDQNEKGGFSSTAYGAMVKGTYGNPNTALCGGYALAYEYLLQQAGIPCAYVTGIADNDTSSSTGAAFHAWNLVLIDGCYYETDVTWDDYDLEKKLPDAAAVSIALSDEETLNNVRHTYYMLSTKEMEETIKKENTTFYLEDGTPFNARMTSSHKRGTSTLNQTDNISIYLNDLLPIAH